jgi:ribosomal protein S18 acetylase RimI-like enzyme
MTRTRKAQLADLDALLRLERNFPGDTLSRRSFRHFLSKAKAAVWVLEAEGELLANAIVLYRKNAKAARLYSLVVDPQARGKGFAKALLKVCEKAALNQGYTQMQLEVRQDNLAAIRLYEQSGYQTVQTIDAYYEDGATALKMRKEL